MENYCVITFQITQHALVFEKNMKELGYTIKLMPVPRQISSSCGTAARIPCDKKQEILDICKERHLQIENFHEIQHKKSTWF